MMDITKKIQAIYRAATSHYDTEQAFERIGENLSPNMRALRLTMTIADTLIAMGVSVADVVSMALDITDRYCQRKVQFDISSTLIIASQDRGNDQEPLTLVRHAELRSTNNMLTQAIQELVRDISHAGVPLEEAEQRLDELLQTPRVYPYWLTTIGSALISSGVGVMLGAKPAVIAIMFFAGAAISYLMRILNHKRVPLFFAQVFAALFITLVAAGTTLASRQFDISWLVGVNPTLIVVGGIIMLVAGLAIVGAVQDAIDEFYVTANARLLKVVMMTIGIVAGVLIGLYAARRMGIYIDVDSEGQAIAQRGNWQLVGSVIIAAGYALSMQTGKFGILLSGAMGALAWVTYQAVGNATPLSTIVASGLAAIAVGIVATLLSRTWRTPSTALITAGIVPLVPGLTLYNGLFELVGNADSTATFNHAGLTLFIAALIALAIASGASFGHLMTRPVRRTVVRARNALPKRKLSRAE